MIRFRWAALAVSVAVATACTKSASTTADTAAPAATAAAPDAAADEQAIRAVNPAWFKAHNSRDIDAMVALYADDAILNVPGAKSAQGAEAIRQAYTKDFAEATKGGTTLTAGTDPKVMVSGDLGADWNTFTVMDKSGKQLVTGKYITVFGRRNGKWVIVNDIWNLDT